MTTCAACNNNFGFYRQEDGKLYCLRCWTYRYELTN